VARRRRPRFSVAGGGRRAALPAPPARVRQVLAGAAASAPLTAAAMTADSLPLAT